MTETNHISNSFETSGASPPAQPVAQQNQAREAPLSAEEKKQRRTLGLKLFDILLYPILTNFAVFGLSVYTTYLTTKGHTQFKPGSFMDKVGNFFHRRGTWMEEKFMGMGMNHDSAAMSKMVTFSFLDGTFIAPFVKLFEDRRERIGKWLDDKLGTTPANLDVYESEPEQTWGTVLKGRAVTVVPVALTAGLLDYTSLNNKFFRDPGLKLGTWMASKPSIAKRFPKTDLPELMKTGLFEGFYTSVCTLGLYVASRAFARRHDAKTGRIETDPVSHKTIVHTPGHAEHVGKQRGDDLAMPSAQVNAVQAQARVNSQMPEHAQSV